MADIIVVAIMVISLVIGYKRGFLKSVSKLFCWIIAIIVAKFLNPTVSQFVSKSFIGEFIKQKFSETSQSLLPENIPQFIAGTGEGIAVGLADVVIGIVSILIVVVATYIIANLLVGALNIVAKLPVISFANRILGGLSGLAIGIIVVYVLMTLVVVFNVDECQEMIDKSIIAYTMYRHNVFIDFIL